MSDETTNPGANSFLESVEQFLEGAESWLSDEDSPAITTLVHLAKALDERMSAPYLQQFGLTYRSLLKKRPGVTEEGDELDDIIPS